MMKYDLGENPKKNWIVAETKFDADLLGKCEATMYLGNGYMGIRSALEERYVSEVRNTFINGTFNKFDKEDVTELPNAPDVTLIDIWINGERFSLEKGSYSEYCRSLDLSNGLLTRKVLWSNDRGERFRIVFRRFVSMQDIHLLGMDFEIEALDANAEIKITSGINGQVSNSGAQHFHEGEKRIFDKKYIQMLQQTTESKIHFVHNVVHNLFIGGMAIDVQPKLSMERRKVHVTHTTTLNKGEVLRYEKLANVHTSLDKEYVGKDLSAIREQSLAKLKNSCVKGFNNLFSESVAIWKDIWQQVDIKINTANDFDQLAIRFAHYHLMIMTPAHDSRFGIGAKALSGEGYKGHSFWDTEIFIVPFFSYSKPQIARTLLEYRYNTINGARKKAKDNGYRGAMYPWESALTGEEETPVWGPVDVITGTATKFWSGFIEQHITGDIAFAVWQYYMITGDEEFMDKYGYEILFDTATFWVSRLEWNEAKREYHK